MSLPNSQLQDSIMISDLPPTPVSSILDAFIVKLSQLFSWLWAAVIFAIAITILVRYGAAKLEIQSDLYLVKRVLSSVFWEELTWYLYGWAWLVSMSYVLVANEHVRVDLIHERLGKSAQVWIEVAGLLFLLIPMLAVVLAHGLDFALSSFRDGEGSQQIGLDFVWVVKFSVPLSILVLVVACISKLLKCFEWMRLNFGTRTHPLLLLLQMVALCYLGSIFYFMYAWSLDVESMTIFRIFGL